MPKIKHMAGMSILMWGFWIVLEGRLDPAGIALGFLVAFALSHLLRDVFLGPGEASGLSAKRFVGWCSYLIWLAVEVIKANIQVAAIVLNPRLPIAPTIISFRSRLNTDFGRMVLGNSITLTPGTVTVKVDGGFFTVHALTLSGAKGLQDSVLERRLRRLEMGGEGS